MFVTIKKTRIEREKKKGNFELFRIHYVKGNENHVVHLGRSRLAERRKGMTKRGREKRKNDAFAAAEEMTYRSGAKKGAPRKSTQKKREGNKGRKRHRLTCKGALRKKDPADFPAKMTQTGREKFRWEKGRWVSPKSAIGGRGRERRGRPAMYVKKENLGIGGRAKEKRKARKGAKKNKTTKKLVPAHLPCK